LDHAGLNIGIIFTKETIKEIYVETENMFTVNQWSSTFAQWPLCKELA